ncbi:hypothetical protein NQ314_014645 [Rhamnusium bicolor]|uniref:Ribosomal protein S13 n=1 Tax=Rhamnusium bicolor TaxID=1586634 RepID=A0AAV8X0Y7_9CUCU|nr:hypothetical protein NQ314_014645 [Rhamnusium bicolor]
MGDMGIKLAPKKTEIVLLYGNRKIDRIEVTVAETRIENQRNLKYLGINIDQGKRMTTLVRNVCMKANKKLNLISRIMTNIGGPKYRKKENHHIDSNVNNSIGGLHLERSAKVQTLRKHVGIAKQITGN